MWSTSLQHKDIGKPHTMDEVCVDLKHVASFLNLCTKCVSYMQYYAILHSYDANKLSNKTGI